MSDLDAKHYRKNSTMQYELATSVLNAIDLKGNETILDVGCGDGRMTAELSQRVPHGSVIGMDPSPSMIDLAMSSFHKDDYPNLSFKTVSAEEMPLEQPVDVILAMNTLHWIRDPKAALRNMASILKPGGTLFILTYPKESPYWKFLEETLQDREWNSFAHRSAFNTILSSHEYKKMIADSGLVVEMSSLEEKIAIYPSADALSSYIKGWLNCYLPLPPILENTFLQKAVKNAQTYSLNNNADEIQLPYFTLTLRARKKKSLFAVIYQGYLKHGCEARYQSAWHKIAAFFVEQCGAISSSLHRTENGLWVAYSRWPDRATRDAAWPATNAASCAELPENIRQEIITLKDCIESQLPEICMEVVDDLSAG